MWRGNDFSFGLFRESVGLGPRWKKFMLNKLAGALGLCLLVTTGEAASGELPAGFVYLADVAREIRQDMRYAGAHNFIGRRVDGYDAAECILTRQAAQGLVRVQAELAPRGYSLIVWDCYRPVRAVRDFVNWSRLPNEARMKAEFFPNTDKANFFQQGYLATRSAHSRGSTVDLGIVPSSLREIPKFDMAGPLKPCTAPKGQRFEDGTIDLGTEHDCLDPQASTISPNISKEAQANRLMLREAMLRAGFKPYSKEWWHFELVDEPFQHAFDFPVVARGAAPAERPLPLAEADRSQQQATIGSQWTEFRLAVLKRQAGVVAKMTKFPLASSSRLLSPPAFIAEFKSIFDGDMTACIALQQPVQSNIGKSTFSLTCALGEKRATLNFQIIDGNWRLFAIEGENEADGEIAKVIEQGRANVEPHVPDAVRMAPKRSPPKVKKASPKAAQSKSEKVEPEAERVQSNEERGSPNGEREQ